MDLTAYKDRTRELVIIPMMEYLEEWEEEEDEGEYTREDVEKCQALIEGYLETLAAMEHPTDDAILEQVKILVLALNDLNEETGYRLIETDAREAIWEVVQTSAEDCGLQDAPEDVTEEWREW